MRARTAVLRSSSFLGHDTGDHVERAARIQAIERELQRRDLIGNRPEVTFGAATDDQILRVHTEQHLQRLEALAASGGGWIDADTVVREDSVNVARLAAGAACAAVDAIANGSIDRAMVIARPPGHHATPNRAMGFCLFNTVAIATEHARANGYQRVAIIDWDVHHGNGTQDAFYGRSDVLFCSMHQWPYYPGTGSSAETGLENGAGFTCNVPLSAGSGDADCLHVMHNVFRPIVESFAPDLIVISAGYDAHEHDPLGDMVVTDEGFQALMRAAIALANQFGGKMLVVLEGGYLAPALATCVADAIEVFDNAAGVG